MRGIKFRGKSVLSIEELKEKEIPHENGWVYGWYVDGWIVGNYADSDDEWIAFEWWSQVDPETVGQFTGLHDMNGAKIFEGDICRDSLGWVFKVMWDSDNARFLGQQEKLRGDTYICYVGRIPAVEVIGNIHDGGGE